MPSRSKQGLFLRKMTSRGKIRLSSCLRDRCGERIRITLRNGRILVRNGGDGFGSRKLARFGYDGAGFGHIEFWKMLPDERVYLSEVEPGVWEEVR